MQVYGSDLINNKASREKRWPRFEKLRSSHLEVIYRRHGDTSEEKQMLFCQSYTATGGMSLREQNESKHWNT